MLRIGLSIAALVLFWAIGYAFSPFIGIPASLLGLVLLFISLVYLGRVPSALLKVSQFCLQHLSVFFIPPLIAAWVYAEQLKQQIWLFILAIVVSTFLSLLITSWLAQRFLRQDSLNKQTKCMPNDDV